MKNKELIKAEIVRRNNEARKAHSDAYHASRLLYWLEKEYNLYDNNGNVKVKTTTRAYLLRYDRPKYRSTILAIRRCNRNSGSKTERYGTYFWYLSDLKANPKPLAAPVTWNTVSPKY